MPVDIDDLKALHADSHRFLKKMVASGGKLKGNFYFVFNTATEAALVVTLVAKDKSGAKALKAGKKLKKDMGATKVAWGTVTADAHKKITFEKRKGGARPTEMKQAIKRALTKEEAGGDKRMKYLLKAVLTSKDEGEQAELAAMSDEVLDEADAREAEEAEQALPGAWEGDDEDLQESLNDLLQEQGHALVGRMGALREAFLAAEDDEAVDEEALERREKLVQDLADRRNGGGSEQEIASLCGQLAELEQEGSNPFVMSGPDRSGLVGLLSDLIQSREERERERHAREREQHAQWNSEWTEEAERAHQRVLDTLTERRAEPAFAGKWFVKVLEVLESELNGLWRARATSRPNELISKLERLEARLLPEGLSQQVADRIEGACEKLSGEIEGWFQGFEKTRTRTEGRLATVKTFEETPDWLNTSLQAEFDKARADALAALGKRLEVLSGARPLEERWEALKASGSEGAERAEQIYGIWGEVRAIDSGSRSGACSISKEPDDWYFWSQGRREQQMREAAGRTGTPKFDSTPSESVRAFQELKQDREANREKLARCEERLGELTEQEKKEVHRRARHKIQREIERLKGEISFLKRNV